MARHIQTLFRKISFFPGKATSPKRSGPFGSLGLPDWVYGPRGLRDPVWDDLSDCTLADVKHKLV